MRVYALRPRIQMVDSIYDSDSERRSAVTLYLLVA